MAESETLTDAAKEIRYKLKSGDPRTPTFNILLLGQQGVGKSSLINSLILALDYKGYREHAKVGKGLSREESAVTLSAKKIQMFKDKKDYPDEQAFETKPVFWDFPGLQNADEKEIITMLLKGYVKPDDTLEELRTWQKRMGGFFRRSSKNNRMHLLIYVHSAVHPASQQLIQSIMDTVQTAELMELETTTFLVLTHADQETVSDEDVQEALDSQAAKDTTRNKKDPTEEEQKTEKSNMKKKLTKEKLRRTADKVSRLFKMEGVWDRIFIVECYSSATAGDEEGRIVRKKSIDEEMCKIWKSIVQRPYYNKFADD